MPDRSREPAVDLMDRGRVAAAPRRGERSAGRAKWWAYGIRDAARRSGDSESAGACGGSGWRN